ncbi:MAG: SpoVA/SpoVAEb family sporulation membrane protein [Oscillospiraceae bacterium]|nr:SpoVA/SpoVAEb family sporulation membrane protein [Oscillospiraceae bacterium]
MPVTKQEYKKMAEKASPPSPSVKNYILAFVVGGLICCAGQFLYWIFHSKMGMDIEKARAWVAVSLIAAAALLTLLNIYPKIAKHAGAGTLVPITGFANAIASSAVEAKSEGYIFGVGAKIFTIAGPVLVYGFLASVVYGLFLWAFK